MFKIKENDLFKKNMSNRELYLLWKKLSNKPVKNKQYGKKVRKQVGRSNSTRSNNNSSNDSKMRDFKIVSLLSSCSTTRMGGGCGRSPIHLGN